METERKDYCFFWPYRQGMLLPAAEKLQKREWEIGEASKDRKLTQKGLLIAAIAIAVTAIIALINFIIKLCE